MITYNNKGALDGFEDWSIRQLCSDFFKGADRNNHWYARLSESFYSWYGKGSQQLRAVDDNGAYHKLASYKDQDSTMYIEPFASLRYVPREGDTIYFTPGCKFPRSRIKRNFKWTAEPTEADVAVLPTVRTIELHKDVYIFFLDRTKELFFLRAGSSYYDLSDDPPEIGQTIKEYVDHRMPHIARKDFEYEDNVEELARIGDAVCRYYGNVISYDKVIEPIIDAINGIYPRIIFENDLLRFVNTDGLEKLTADLIESLDLQINSSDSATRCIGLKLLASMDYRNKPSVAKYLLRHIDQWKQDAYCSAGVEFMRKTLNISLRNYWIPDSEVYGHISSNEAPIMRDIIERECQKKIEKVIKDIQRDCNLEIHADSTITVEEPCSL